MLIKSQFAYLGRGLRVIFLGPAAALIISAAFLVGCASQAIDEPPQAEFAEAQSNLDAAEQAGARENATAELAQAQDKLESARKASEAENYLDAKRLAEQAAVDAEMASAKAQRAEQEATLAELEEGIATLEQELQRNEGVR